MKKIIILLVPVVFSFISCSSGNNAKSAAATTDSVATAPVAKYDNTLAKGKVMDSVICPTQSYALYLPTYYTSDKKFPCIFFFDAHGRGALPLNMYKDLAEKYGFILIGSNASKNGTQWEATNEAAKALMEDVHTRMNIDAKRTYAAGFSGGARVASSIAISDGGLAGVIGCAAGFPKVDFPLQNKFDYFGMVGDYDFNLTEMEQLDHTLDQNGFAHQLLTFGGKHGWAPATDFQTALLWIQANAMKENLQPQNDTLLTALKNDYDKRIATAKASNDFIKLQELLSGSVKTLDGLLDMAAYKKQLADLTASTAFKNAMAQQAQLQQAEQNQQQELAKEFTAQNEMWWSGKIAELNHNVHSAKTKATSQMNQRLLNFLGLISYLNSDHALNTGDLANAVTYISIFKQADPQNPDCAYLAAIRYMKENSPQKAITALHEAVSLGYSDVSLLTTNPDFSSIQTDADFQSILTKARANTTKQE